jgi:hypothetical protein
LGLKSWVIESSLDGKVWTELDRKINNNDLKEWPYAASYPVSDSTEFRFIRLTQTGNNLCGDDRLIIRYFEVFGNFLE